MELLVAWANWLRVVGLLLIVAAALIAFVRTGRRRPLPTYREKRPKDRDQRGSIRTWRDAA
jgi:hypothetical protein